MRLSNNTTNIVNIRNMANIFPANTKITKITNHVFMCDWCGFISGIVQWN